MHMHPIETAAIAKAAANGEGRFNLYAAIHKALRHLMADTLHAVGRADPDDNAEVREAAERVIELVEFCERHIEHENRFIHPALRARCPGVCDAVASEHDDHLNHIAQLREAAHGLASLPGNGRAASLHALYLALALFVADNLQHMHSEETRHNAALWAACTDLELLALHDALVATIPPAEMMLVARWMLPSLNAGERTMMINDMQGRAPPEAVEAVLGLARQQLDDRQWAKLTRSINLPPVPGLVTV